MLRAYIDETEYEGRPPLFVLGGYIASVEQWHRLSNEWQEVLELTPRVRYFKLREALKGTGQFHRMPEERRIEKIALVRMCVEKNVQAEFGIAFRLDWFRKIFPAGDKTLRNPYYYAANNLLSELVLGSRELGVDKQPIDFIFDNRVREKAELIKGWSAVVEIQHDPSSPWAFMRNPPSFQDDLEVPPLQAADMQATILRMSLTENFSETQLPGYGRRIRGMLLCPDRAEMLSWLSELVRHLKAMDDNGESSGQP